MPTTKRIKRNTEMSTTQEAEPDKKAKWRERSRDEINAYQRAYRARDPDKWRIYKNEYYRIHKRKIALQRMTRYQQKKQQNNDG
jgi:hypothetical protein